jgi:hypothetical protein
MQKKKTIDGFVTYNAASMGYARSCKITKLFDGKTVAIPSATGKDQKKRYYKETLPTM